MSTFDIHAVSPPAGEVAAWLIRINHATWPAPLRYAIDAVDWTVTDENDDEVTFTSKPGEVESAGTDETAIDSRSVTLADLDLVLWRLLEKLSRTGDTQPVEVTIYVYLSTDLTAPAIAPAVLTMANPSRDGRIVTFEASTINTINRDAPTRKFTWANSPGLRR